MDHSSVLWEIVLLYFFSRNFIWLGQKEPIKVQNFRLSTAHVKFHQICTLIGSFCRKYIKFQLKKYRGVVSWHWKVMQNLKKNQFVVSKLTRIWWILIQALKSIKNLHFDWSLSCTLKCHVKFEEKLTYGFKDDKNLANFRKNTWKCYNWDFDGILLSKVENAWAKKLQSSYV